MSVLGDSSLKVYVVDADHPVQGGAALPVYIVNYADFNGGGGGVTDHALLTHLDYASSGHTGFEQAGAASSAVIAHVALSDPHTQYALSSSLGTAAALNTGTATGNVVQYTGTNQITASAGVITSIIQPASDSTDATGFNTSAGVRIFTVDTVGALVRVAGNVVIKNNSRFAARNAANDADINLFSLDNSNNLLIGAAATVIDTFFSTSSSMRISVGGNEVSRHTSSVLIINNGGLDIDFRVAGDTQSHLLFCDAGLDRVGIGQSSPNNKLDVAGTVQMDSLRIDVTPTNETVVCTHTIAFSANGINYKIPCVPA